MILTALGLIITLIPFLLVFCFKNRILGFLSVFAGLSAFHFIIGIIAQLLHIFNPPTIFSASAVLALSSLLVFFKKEKLWPKKPINWLVVAGFAIIIFQLWSVHYRYTGAISTINGYQETTHNSYSFPYFSDEWVSASLAKYSLEHHAFPVVNPLNHNLRVTNPLAPFFSFLAEIFLILNLDPINNFPMLVILAGFLVCLFAYLFLRANKISPLVALITVVGLTYITNGANLPGIWYLLPYTFGLIMLLAGLTALSLKNEKLAGAYSLFALILYPPMIVFVAPLWLAWWGRNIRSQKTAKYAGAALLMAALILTVIIGMALGDFNLGKIFQAFSGYLIRPNLNNGIPQFMIWNIIPLIFLPLVLLGMIKIIKDKFWPFAAPIFAGLVWWIFYLFAEQVVIIEYARVAAITAILLVLASGFGLNYLLQISREKYPAIFREEIVLGAKTFLLLFVLLLSFSYTNQQNWSKLVLRENPQEYNQTVPPASPANTYLRADDLQLFAGLQQKIFIAPPWKGLVIGVATNNFPLQTKSSSITNQIISYGDFLAASCAGKNALAEKTKLDYAYSKPFACPRFKFVGRSTEDLFLYQFQKY